MRSVLLASNTVSHNSPPSSIVDREVSALCELEHLQQLDLMGTRNVTCAAVKELLERRSDQGPRNVFSASFIAYAFKMD